MPDSFTAFVTSVREAISGTGSRSHILNPLLIPLGILGIVLVATFRYGAPPWLQIAVAAAFAIVLLVYIGFFAFFAFTTPEFLRSERYSIQKLAIEKGIVGDSQAGIIDLQANPPPDGTLPKPDDKNGGKK